MNTNRCRTLGVRRDPVDLWISALPGSSAGCALPANTNCTGRSSSSSRAHETLDLLSSSVARL
jgi:hypothetical protein